MFVLFTFYRKVIWLESFLTLCGCLLIWSYGSWQFAVPVFWMKIFSNAFIGLYTFFFNNDEFVFYRNLGFGRWLLFSGAFVIDMIIWLVATIFTLQILL
jgi:hypothetical protein